MAIGRPTVSHFEYLLPAAVGLLCVLVCIRSAVAVWRRGEYPTAFRNAAKNSMSRNLFWMCMTFGIALGTVIAAVSLDVAIYAR